MHTRTTHHALFKKQNKTTTEKDMRKDEWIDGNIDHMYICIAIIATYNNE